MNLVIDNIIILHKKNMFTEALSEINKYEKNNNLDPILLNLKGITNLLLNDFDNALKYFNEAIEIISKLKNNNNALIASIYNNKGLVNIKLAKNDDAIKDFKEAIQIKPDFTEGYNNLGIVFQNMGEKYESLKYFIEANNLDQNYIPAINNLINSLPLFENIEYENNNIVNANKKLKKLSFKYDPLTKINEEDIRNIFEKSNKIINEHFNKINYKPTQSFRRGNRNLNCDRHMKIFNENNIIPKYCFSCYKILIEPKNIVDLIKLHILFDNLNLKKNNIRKCMIEKRKNISGRYKGFIYCETMDEAKLILDEISSILEINIDKNIKYKIKRGCSEYVESYPDYKNLSENIMTYNNKWVNKEDLSDKKYPFLKNDLKNKKTVSGNSLQDILIIKNWLVFAKTCGDQSYKNISDECFQ